MQDTEKTAALCSVVQQKNVKFRIQQQQTRLTSSKRHKKLGKKLLNGFSPRRVIFELYGCQTPIFELSLCTLSIYMSLNKPSVLQMGATKRNSFG